MEYTAPLDPGPPPPPGFCLSPPSDWSYLTSGASNSLFRYTGPHPYFVPFLLRLRKHLPGSPTTKQLFEHLETRFKPILEEYLPLTVLIRLEKGFAAELNQTELPEGTRWRLEEGEEWGLLVQDLGAGVYLSDDPDEFSAPEEKEEDEEEQSGVDADGDTDMAGAEEGEEEEEEGREKAFRERWRDLVTLEFKPKWLAQSPNAPRGWRRCRTCAMRAMKNRVGDDDGDDGDDGEEVYCPLDLVSDVRSRVSRAVRVLLGREEGLQIADPVEVDDEGEVVPGEYTEDEMLSHELCTLLMRSLDAHLTEYFLHSRLIRKLAELQEKFGARGVFTAATLHAMEGELGEEDGIEWREGVEADVWTAMTLRDCSVFIKVWVRRREDGGKRRLEVRFEARVADLDLKTGEGGRAVYWRDQERRLRLGGWYGEAGGVGRNCRTGLVVTE